MPVYLDDKRMVKRLLRGDERAFDQFFDQNFSRLYRFAKARMSDDREATREVVLATLNKAIRKIDSYLGEAALFTWLCVICRNEIVDWARRNAKYREHVVFTEDYPEVEAAVNSLLTPATDSPGRQYQRHEISRLVQVALDRLPPHYGDALEWKYIEGYSVKEIAGRMGLSPDAVQSLLARARKAFEEVYSALAKPILHPAVADFSE